MKLRGKDVALSALVVGTAAAVGYVWQSSGTAEETARSRADIGARIVEEVPTGVTLLDASDERVQAMPPIRDAIEGAIEANARERWTNVTFDREGAWSLVDAIRTSLPYYESDGGGYNGVYVRWGGQVVVVDAIGWAHVDSVVR